MSTLENRLEQGNARAWRPDQDDEALLVGEVVDIDSGSSEYQGTYPILTVRKDDGEEVAVHAFHTVLKNELVRQRPKAGERIGIKFLGEQATKPGSLYKSFIGYRVKVDRAAGDYDWSQVGAEPEPEPAAPPVDIPADANDDDSIPF
jgi:hypothetical protein